MGCDISFFDSITMYLLLLYTTTLDVYRSILTASLASLYGCFYFFCVCGEQFVLYQNQLIGFRKYTLSSVSQQSYSIQLCDRIEPHTHTRANPTHSHSLTQTRHNQLKQFTLASSYTHIRPSKSLMCYSVWVFRRLKANRIKAIFN